MGYVAVVFLGVVCLLNLVLIVSLSGRVSRLGRQLGRPGHIPPPPRVPAGHKAPDFTVTTIDGRTRSLSDLRGARGVVAFLAPGSTRCSAQVPELLSYARALPDGPAQVIVVVSGAEGGETAELVRALGDSVSVVVEPVNGPMQHTFGVSDFPLVFVLNEDGRVGARGANVQAFDGAHLRLAAG